MLFLLRPTPTLSSIWNGREIGEIQKCSTKNPYFNILRKTQRKFYKLNVRHFSRQNSLNRIFEEFLVDCWLKLIEYGHFLSIIRSVRSEGMIRSKASEVISVTLCDIVVYRNYLKQMKQVRCLKSKIQWQKLTNCVASDND